MFFVLFCPMFFWSDTKFRNSESLDYIFDLTYFLFFGLLRLGFSSESWSEKLLNLS